MFIPAKLRPRPIWNDGNLDFFEDGRSNNKKKNNNNKMSSDMASVADQNIPTLPRIPQY